LALTRAPFVRALAEVEERSQDGTEDAAERASLHFAAEKEVKSAIPFIQIFGKPFGWCDSAVRRDRFWRSWLIAVFVGTYFREESMVSSAVLTGHGQRRSQKWTGTPLSKVWRGVGHFSVVVRGQ
jgi:hypothetical protein